MYVKPITEKVAVSRTVDEWAELNNLIAKDTPLRGCLHEDKSINHCPKCNAKFAPIDRYCSMCGQRVLFVLPPDDYNEEPVIEPL